MPKQQLKAFLKAVESATGLQEKLRAAGDADAVVAIAQDAGFMISSDDIKKAQAAISEEELEGVAGGNRYGKRTVEEYEAKMGYLF